MALKDKLMTLEDFKAVRDVDVASNSAQFTEIKADLAYTAQSVYAYKSEPFPASIDSNGAIVSVQPQSTDRVMYFAVKPNSIISTTGAISLHAFYTTEPTIGAVSYNGSRTGGGLTNVNVPDGCNWLAIRTSAANVSGVDLNPKSLIVSDINKINTFNTQYSFTVFAHNHILDKYYATNGSVGTNATYNYYEKIPVVSGNTYLLTGKGARYCVLYNNNTIVQTAENVSVFTANYDGDLYVTEYASDPISMYLYNDFFKLDTWTNKNINGKLGTATSNNIAFATNEGDICHFKLNGYSGQYFTNCILYAVQSGGNVIVASLYSDTGEYVFIAPSATTYIVYINKSQSETATINFELTNLSKNTIFNSITRHDISNRFMPHLYGKKIACLGDSFTYGVATYVAKMNNRYLSKAINYGVASSRIVLDTTSGGNTIQSFLNRYSAMDNDAEIVTIFGGINDSYDIGSGALALGDISSALDTTTFYGGLKLLVTNLMKKYPDKQIIGIIPPDCQTGEYYIANLPAVQNAEREVYNMYGIPIIDLKRECYKMSTLSEMVALYRAASDNIHPSNAGQEALCDTISAGIRRIIP